MGTIIRTLIQFAGALLVMSSRAATFGRAFDFLPARVRLMSPGFIGMSMAFFLASIGRHGFVGDSDLSHLLQGRIVYYCMLLALSRNKYAAELTLYMAASVGVDLTISALGLAGLDITAKEVSNPAWAWECIAAAVVIIRYKLSQPEEEAS